ncbi:o-succinylbenzoate--CoA ligase [Macrococcus brunensis]|uniref:o-succinylbenzoate--CoA ligase n=1 Tax=Macrococcus brunensis TaxID=198483 RepID=UPI001EEFBDD9|nr:o-succinylbenzoate--CoA ligase [Macrococcus brunensis]ULG73724.1 o-succinylbenzoate--CoA ligase [Macrococcus brunensis]
MQHNLVKQAKERPDHIAVKFNESTLTFAELYEQASAVKDQLLEMELPSRIAVQPTNQLNSVIIMHAIVLAHIEMVLINTHLTESEVKRQLDSIGVSIIITENNYTSLSCIMPETLFKGMAERSAVTTYNPEDIMSIMFTSGTTGVQKAVPHTFLNHVASAERCKISFPFDRDSKWLLALPLYHISGLSVLVRSVMDGFTIVLFDKFDANAINQSIAEDEITHISLVPQTLEWLLEAGLERHKLEGLLIGGAKLDDRTLEECLKRDLPVYTSFGMTETASQFITASPTDMVNHPNSVGPVTDDIKVAAPLNGAGEILVRGDNVMKGYLYPEGANDTAFSGDYFMTGDVGHIKNGYLYVLDRRKDLIISGGENIYPSEIEQLILSIPDISACSVVGIPDAKWGEVPALVYESDSDLDAKITETLQEIAKYKRPVLYKRIKQLHRTSNGKISRHLVKEWLLDEIQ